MHMSYLKIALFVMISLAAFSLLFCKLAHDKKSVTIIKCEIPKSLEIEKIEGCDDSCVLFDDIQELMNIKNNKKPETTHREMK